MSRPTAASRRRRAALLTAILLIAATASIVIANVIATRLDARFDVTATRAHRLSPRTQTLLDGLGGEYEVVIAAPLRDPRLIDPRAAEGISDLLDQLARAGGGRIRTTSIDTGSASGLASYDALVRRLSDRDSARIQAQAQVVATALDRTDALAGWLDGLSPRLQTARDAIPEDSPSGVTNRAYFDQRAAEARIFARSARDLVAKARETLSKPVGTLPFVDPVAAADPLRQPLADLQSGLNDIAENTRRFATAEAIPAAARSAARPISDEAAAKRDEVGLIRDSLDRLERLDLLRIAHALQSSSAALIIGPPGAGVTAIDIAQLLPPPPAPGTNSNPDAGRNAEELLATAIASLSEPIKPIVVFVHGQPARGLLRSPDFVGLLDRLALRGIDAAEWAAAVDPAAPEPAKLDPTGKRPIVYVVMSTDTSANPARGQSGPERASKLGKALVAIAESGRPVLLSLNPSTLPTFGDADPMTAVLPAFGLKADTGRPLLKERFAADGRHVDAYQTLTPASSDNPLSSAVRGLPTRFEWPIAIAIDDAAKDRARVIYEIDDPATWPESQWLTYWQVRIQDHERFRDPPKKDSERDAGQGPWPIVVAVQRPRPDGQPPQRMVVAGSNSWFMDRIAQERILVDGRPAATNPGNAELFEAAVYWLAGQDRMIAQTPTARATPLVRTLSRTTLVSLRWLAVAGLPGFILLLGLVWRLVRG